MGGDWVTTKTGWVQFNGKGGRVALCIWLFKCTYALVTRNYMLLDFMGWKKEMFGDLKSVGRG